MSASDLTTSCGLFKWRPKWLQKFARKEVYAVVYSLIGVIQGMGFSYLSAVLSTIEKQFGIKSKETAWVFSGNEISQIMFIFALPFLGLIKRRTLWTSLSMILTSLGLFLCALPFFIKDKSSYKDGWTGHKSSNQFCGSGVETDDFCNTHRIRDPGGMVTIFFGFFISGIGSSFYNSFGIPYIDDNTSKNRSPLFLGLIYGTKTLGPGLGSLLGSACLKLYVFPGLEGDLVEGDEGWLGAWWLGFVIVGGLTAIIAPLLAFFPQRLPSVGEKTDAKVLEKELQLKEKTGKEFIQETKECTRRLLRNKVYMWNLFAATAALLCFSGLGTFFPKYLEYHFRQKASKSGLSSMGTSIGTAFGVALGGAVISKYKFRARTLAAWSVFIGCVGILAMIIFGFLACPKLEVYSMKNNECLRDCECSGVEFNPTCSMDGQTLFFSPCYAGCKTRRKEIFKDKEKYIYEDCSCVKQSSGNLNLSELSAWWMEDDSLSSPLLSATLGSNPDYDEEGNLSGAVEGFCPSEDCDNMFLLTMAFIAIVSLLASTARVGGSIINLRVIEPQDKSAAITILISALSLFALFPSPLMYGALMDSTCTVWGQRCGEVTNCQLYDTDQLRHLMSWVTTGLMVLSLLGDIMVWRHVGDLQLYQEDEDKDKTEDMHLS